MASCSSCSVQKYNPEQRSKSCDTVCSSNSSCYLQRRKPIHPLATGFRTNYARPTGNAVRQRVLSAKLLKLRSIQNQLNDANFHLAELARENQALKTLQKRQDKALSRYEGANADLPRLLQSHEDEIRALTERNKSLRKTVKELNEQTKQKEEELGHVKDQLKHLDKLNRDKHLGEREKLADQVEEMKIKINKYEEQVKTLNRKIELESKAFKYKLNNEMTKHRQCQKELAQALTEIDNLTRLLDSTGRVTMPNQKRVLPGGPKRQSMSLVSLSQAKLHSGNNSDKNSTEDLLGTKDVKLEPIHHRKEENHKSESLNGIMKSPAEKVKARLSANGHRYTLGAEKKVSESRSSTSSDNKSTVECETGTESRSDSLHSMFTMSSSSRPSSSQKLEKISTAIEATIQKAIDNGSNEFEVRLGSYCSEVANTVKNCSDVIESHAESLKNSKADTETIMQALKETQELEKKLKHSSLLSINTKNVSDDNLDFINEILKEEANFQKQTTKNQLSNGKIDKNANITKKNKVPQDDKRKLLATLKAIDNGDSVESVEEMPQHESNLKESESVESFGGDLSHMRNKLELKESESVESLGDMSQRKSKLMSELFGDLDL